MKSALIAMLIGMLVAAACHNDVSSSPTNVSVSSYNYNLVVLDKNGNNLISKNSVVNYVLSNGQDCHCTLDKQPLNQNFKIRTVADTTLSPAYGGYAAQVAFFASTADQNAELFLDGKSLGKFSIQMASSGTDNDPSGYKVWLSAISLNGTPGVIDNTVGIVYPAVGFQPCQNHNIVLSVAR